MSLRSKRNLRVARKSEDFNPMEGMSNLADVMLVFACGLLLALIINWNVDVSDVAQVQQEPEAKYEVEGLEGGETQTVDGDSQLEEMGTVYKDPETGKYYVVEEE